MIMRIWKVLWHYQYTMSLKYIILSQPILHSQYFLSALCASKETSFYKVKRSLFLFYFFLLASSNDLHLITSWYYIQMPTVQSNLEMYCGTKSWISKKGNSLTYFLHFLSLSFFFFLSLLRNNSLAFFFFTWII